MTEDLTTNDTLVLTDQDGNIYAIPRSVVESHRLTAEQKAGLEEQIGDDVAGFQMQNPFLIEKMAGYHQDARRQEGQQERMVRSSEVSEDEPAIERARPASPRTFLVGVWRSIASLRTTP